MQAALVIPEIVLKILQRAENRTAMWPGGPLLDRRTLSQHSMSFAVIVQCVLHLFIGLLAYVCTWVCTQHGTCTDARRSALENQFSPSSVSATGREPRSSDWQQVPSSTEPSCQSPSCIFTASSQQPSNRSSLQPTSNGPMSKCGVHMHSGA